MDMKKSLLHLQQEGGFFMELLDNPLFYGVSRDELSQMEACFEMERKTYHEKEELPIDGKIGILLSGCVSLNRLNIDGNLDMLEYLSDGGIFGTFISLLDNQGDMIAICEKACSVIFIDSRHITKRCERACHHHSVVVENLLNLMTDKVQQLSEKVEILSHRTIRDKLLCYFRMQSSKKENNSFLLPFSFSALANYLCVDRSAMTRELRKMKTDGLIEIDGRKVLLHTS